ncbi:MAG: hypothetical protein KAY65_16710 [Planctomycetes bacterium]|nr:hypothetical protein [Planctomycetota bacterium]
MKAARSITLWCLLILLATSGCGKKEEANVGTDVEVDESKPISQVKAEAEKMDAQQLRAIAMKYKEVIVAKTAEVDKVAMELMQMMLADKSSDRMKTLKAQTDKLNQSIEALTAQFEVYCKKLDEKGGDLSGLMQ